MDEALLHRKYQQLLAYIAELDRLRTSTVRRAQDHVQYLDLTQIPVHEDVIWDPSEPARFLTVTRCDLPISPECPEVLQEWVRYEPNQLEEPPSRLEKIVVDDQELEWENSELQEVWEAWLQSWKDWVEEAIVATKARQLYGTLYDLYAVTQRNVENLELVVGDVVVSYDNVDHPLLINPVQIQFDAEYSRISIGCLDEPAQVYGDAIREVLPKAGDSIARARKEVLENPDIWALGAEDVDSFGKRFVQGADAEGEFISGNPAPKILSARRHPFLILRKRASGLAELAEGLLAKFQEDGVVPTPIQPVLVERDEPEERQEDFSGEPDEDPLSYFTKPANLEQLAILRNYRRSGCVHVQGPPGTGKTHTIANLIGHFLAEGKSVLVTSEKAQALTVLREKVVEQLRTLCVSLADSDATEGLKSGMRGLYENLSSNEERKLTQDAERLDNIRKQTIESLHTERQKLKEIIQGEYIPIEEPGWRGSPIQAGQFLNEHRSSRGWLPLPIEPESEPPISEAEFQELLGLYATFPVEVLPEIRKPLPPVHEIPSPSELRALIDSLETLEQSQMQTPAAKVTPIKDLQGGSKAAEGLVSKVEDAIEQIASLDSSYREFANRAAETPHLVEKWEQWIREAKVLLEREHAVMADVAPFGLSYEGDPLNLLDAAKELLQHIQKSGRSFPTGRFLNRSDKALIKAVKCKRPIGEELALRALISRLEFDDDVQRFRSTVEAGAQSGGLAERGFQVPERDLVRDTALQTSLRWSIEVFPLISNSLSRHGFGEDQMVRHLPVSLSGKGKVEHQLWWLEFVIRPALLQYIHSEKVEALRQQKSILLERARKWKTSDCGKTLLTLADSLISLDVKAYEQIYSELEELRAASDPVCRRDHLVQRLQSKAALFAQHLEGGSFLAASIKSSLAESWTYALVEQEVDRRHGLSIERTKEEIDRLKRQLDKVTIDLAFSKAWSAQHKRVTQPVRSALARFHEAQKRIGKGKGKRSLEFERAMKNAMHDAKDAFPVWIMPLHQVAKSFDFTKTRFDVVIVDESSQLSATGLITLLIADSAIVVGDDEQTEPSLVGVNLDRIKGLIDEHLVDFKDKVLWSPESSLYSFAARFGATVGLREHFRCVPEIISFSSKLCYQGKIQPLRESTGVEQLPYVVPILCKGGSMSSGGAVNEEEALEIASLLIACSQDSAYEGQSFGVIALRGSEDATGLDPQSNRITSILISALGAVEWERLKAQMNLKFGLPSAFQGDERDVVFISVGDTAEVKGNRSPGPIKLLAEDSIPGQNYKKRMNVAVSRARNQVWIVHSFAHHEGELKDGDVRKRLFEFAYAPKEWYESTLAVNPNAESVFEEAVYSDLVARGYVLTPQFKVGHYRIDLVAEDANGRVAIECDGDAFHTDAAADLARQSVLERCGWKFIRIRGSEYFRRPEATIDRVVKDLERLGVWPTHFQTEHSEPEGELLSRVRGRASEIKSLIKAGRTMILGADALPSQMQSKPLESSDTDNANVLIEELNQDVSDSEVSHFVVNPDSEGDDSENSTILPPQSPMQGKESSPVSEPFFWRRDRSLVDRSKLQAQLDFPDLPSSSPEQTVIDLFDETPEEF